MPKIIVDTSVWIDFFKKSRLSETILSHLVIAIENEQVVITDVIAHELLVGTLTEKDYREMKDLLSPFSQLGIQQDALDDFNQFVWKCHRRGLPGRYTDMTIAYLAHAYQYPILSFDHFFNRLAKIGLIEVIKFS